MFMTQDTLIRKIGGADLLTGNRGEDQLFWVTLNEYQRNSHEILFFSNPMELQNFHTDAFPESSRKFPPTCIALICGT